MEVASSGELIQYRLHGSRRFSFLVFRQNFHSNNNCIGEKLLVLTVDNELLIADADFKGLFSDLC